MKDPEDESINLLDDENRVRTRLIRHQNVPLLSIQHTY